MDPRGIKVIYDLTDQIMDARRWIARLLPRDSEEANRHDQVLFPKNPGTLVCDYCWNVRFSTERFRDICRAIENAQHVCYVVDRRHIWAPAAMGCTWCSLVLELVQESEELASPENRVMSVETYVLLGIGNLGMALKESHPAVNNRFSLYVNNMLHRITAFTSDDKVSSNTVTAKQLQSDVGSEKAFQQITRWLAVCATHSQCRPPSMSELPTRVIDVSPGDGPATPRLLLTKGLQKVSMPHCPAAGADQVNLE